MKNSNGSGTARWALTIVLGAATLVSGTLSITNGLAASKAAAVEKDMRDFKDNDFANLRSEFDVLKGQILAELKNLSDSQSKMETALQEHLRK